MLPIDAKIKWYFLMFIPIGRFKTIFQQLRNIIQTQVMQKMCYKQFKKLCTNVTFTHVNLLIFF